MTLLVFSSIIMALGIQQASGAKLNKHKLKSYGNGVEGTFASYSLNPSTITVDGNKFEDGRTLGFNLTYDSDWEAWLNWERNDIIEH